MFLVVLLYFLTQAAGESDSRVLALDANCGREYRKAFAQVFEEAARKQRQEGLEHVQIKVERGSVLLTLRRQNGVGCEEVWAHAPDQNQRNVGELKDRVTSAPEFHKVNPKVFGVAAGSFG